jgi:hypothetical protein
MPDSIDDYVQSLLRIVAAAHVVRSSNVVLDKRTLRSGLVRGDLYFLDGSRLHFRELIDVQTSTVRLMYSYHYQKADGALVFRYDDTPHHANVLGFPFHKHVSQEDNVIPAEPPDLRSVLQEIQNIYPIDTSSNL